jgi:annexin A7/11
MHNETEAIFKALKGFGTNEKDLIRILHHLDPIQAANLQEQYKTRFTQDLAQRLEKEVSGYFRDGIVSIVQGPLISDCINLRNATKGLGTQEAILDDILVGRSNADINAIKAKYQELFRTSLEADLRGDLSAGTEEMFVMIIHARRAESSAPVNPQEIEQHVGDLQSAMGNFVSKNTTRACELILYKNDQQTNALADAWRRRFHKSLAEDIEAKFSGHMEGTLLLHLQRAQNRALSDAIKLEDSMAGIGTKDKLLVQRVIRAHWDRRHMAQVRHEYQTKYKKDLVKRVKGETSGDYCKLMVACIE